MRGRTNAFEARLRVGGWDIELSPLRYCCSSDYSSTPLPWDGLFFSSTSEESHSLGRISLAKKKSIRRHSLIVRSLACSLARSLAHYSETKLLWCLNSSLKQTCTREIASSTQQFLALRSSIKQGLFWPKTCNPYCRTTYTKCTKSVKPTQRHGTPATPAVRKLVALP